jgi:hypothetical protein
MNQKTAKYSSSIHKIAERQRVRVLLVSCVIERAGISCMELPARSQPQGKMASFLEEMTPFLLERR